MPADVLTILRLAGALGYLIYIGAVGQPEPLTALVLGVSLAATDAFDGVVAKIHGSSGLGVVLDPIADKFLFWAFSWAFLDATPVGVVLSVTYGLYGVTFIAILVCWLWWKMPKEVISDVFRSNMFGKAKGFLQMAALVYLYLIAYGWIGWFQIPYTVLGITAVLEAKSQHAKWQKIQLERQCEADRLRVA